VTDPDRMSVEILRSQLKRVFDLYALGKNILRILKKCDIADYKRIPIYHRRYMKLMACRMLDGHNDSDDECALNLSKSAFNEIKYSSADEVLLDIKKLTGEYSINKEIPELDHHFPKTIQISSSAASAFTPRVADILSLPLIRRLARVSQLGLIVQIYPTATHSRHEHLLGTFVNVVRYCDSLWNDPFNPFFKQIITKHDINLVLVAALCHDLGQYPLSHDLEEAEKKLFSHKKIVHKLLTDSDNEESISLKNTMREDWEVEPEDVSELLSTDPNNLYKPLKMRLLHTLIDGPIDADKIDYLIRDSNNLNVPYGKSIDLERLFKCLTIVFKKDGNDKTFISLGIHEKGKIPAEAVAFSRYAMFGNVYWHHTSRSLKSMLHRAVWEVLQTLDDKTKYQELEDALLNEILGQHKKSSFSNDTIREISKAPQLSLSDYRMLKWIHNITSGEGKKLLEMVCERKLLALLPITTVQVEVSG